MKPSLRTISAWGTFKTQCLQNVLIFRSFYRPYMRTPLNHLTSLTRCQNISIYEYYHLFWNERVLTQLFCMLSKITCMTIVTTLRQRPIDLLSSFFFFSKYLFSFSDSACVPQHSLMSHNVYLYFALTLDLPRMHVKLALWHYALLHVANFAFVLSLVLRRGYRLNLIFK